MYVALLSFVQEPAQDELGKQVEARLSKLEGVQVVRESLRPDLPRLKGLLLAALTDPRFDGIVVVADLDPAQNENLVQQVESTLQQQLPAWQTMVSQVLWPQLGSDLLWAHSCLGRTHQRLLAALTGAWPVLETQLESLLIPQLPRLLRWAQAGSRA